MLTVLFSIWIVGLIVAALWTSSAADFPANVIVGAVWPLLVIIVVCHFASDWLWPKRMPHEQHTAEAWAPELNSLRNENQDLRNRNAELHRKIKSLNEDFVRLTKNYEAAARTLRRVREAACDMTGDAE